MIGSQGRIEEDSDRSLMARFRSGEEEAFRVLFDRYASHLVNFAFRFLNSKAEAEDLSQDVLLRVYKGREGYDPGRPFRPWIFSIASRLVSNRLRDRRRHPQEPLEGPGVGLEVSRPEPADLSHPLPPEALERGQAVRAVQEALSALPESQRVVVLLSRFERMSYQEIAQALGTSEEAVKSLLYRARQGLKRLLLPYVSGPE